MAEIMKCFLHTSRDALIRCKQCGKPLCYECRKTTEIGAFCSDECYLKSKSFTERASEHSKKKSSYFGIRGLLKNLVFLIILIAIIWALDEYGPAPVQNVIDSTLDSIKRLF